jgi:tetratricopeptide (TPR) repeat protein
MASVDELRIRAELLERAGDWGQRALATNREIVMIVRTDPRATLRAAKCQLALNSPDEAVELLQGLAKSPGIEKEVTILLAEARVRSAEKAAQRKRWVSEQAKQRADARRRLLEAVRDLTDPTQAMQLGKLAGQHYDHELALAYHRRAVELATPLNDSLAIATRAALGAALRKADKPEESLRVLDESVALDSSRVSNRASYTARVATLRAMGHLAKATDEGEAQLAVNSDDPFALNALMGVLKDRAIFENDSALLERAFELAERAARLPQRSNDAMGILQEMINA